MNVAALVSGGKDSVFALHCMEMSGFDVTHVVRVVPRADDSWMFHVPNLGIVPLQAEAMGKPLVTIEVSGEAEREVTELETGLRGLEVDALCSGAVASEYQRTRLDRVGHRLGFKTFAPLWHKRPRDVLETLIAARYDVRFAAVAAEGLGEEWLGRRLDPAAVEELEALRASRGVHAVGEGGEFETLVLDGPPFRRRVVVDLARREWRRDRGVWRVEAAHLEAK
ncbi:MAG TPA: diphthine--ammonia ligase [Candidatus Thermoplasmatota archaeon]|nr:diphthine--ammonia ligase [Candidatus Thermoplasmatota archaeon]